MGPYNLVDASNMSNSLCYKVLGQLTVREQLRRRPQMPVRRCRLPERKSMFTLLAGSITDTKDRPCTSAYTLSARQLSSASLCTMPWNSALKTHLPPRAPYQPCSDKVVISASVDTILNQTRWHTLAPPAAPPRQSQSSQPPQAPPRLPPTPVYRLLVLPSLPTHQSRPLARRLTHTPLHTLRNTVAPLQAQPLKL